MTPSNSAPHTSSVSKSIDPGHAAAERLATQLGLITAAWFALIFWYPARAFPLQSFFLLMIPALASIVIAVMAWRGTQHSPASLREKTPIIALLLYALWMFARWRTMELPIPGSGGAMAWIPSPGRHAVITAIWTVPLISLGWVAGKHGSAFWRKFAWGMFIAAAIYATYGMAQFFFLYEANRRELLEALGATNTGDALMDQSLLHAFEEKRIGGRLGNGNVFAAQMVVMLAVSGGLLMDLWHRRGRLRSRILIAATFAGIILAVLLTQSRGGFLTLLFAIGIGGMLHVKSIAGSSAGLTGKRAASLLFIVVAISCVIGFALRERLSNLSTIRERLNYWEVAGKVWAMHPIIGSGPGSYELMYPLLKPPTARESKFTHSWFFQTGAETGGGGLLLICVFAGCTTILPALHRSRFCERSKGAFDQQTWLGLACAVLLFNGLFEYSLQTREFWLLLAFAGGGTLGMSSHEAGPSRSLTPPIFRKGTIILLLCPCAVSIAATYMTWRESMTEFYRWEGQILSADGKQQLAGFSYRRAIDYDPMNGGLWVAAAMAYLSSKMDHGLSQSDPSEVALLEELMEHASKLNPLSPSIRRSQATFFHATDEPAKALAKMDEAIAIYPNDAGYRLDRAEMAIQAGNETKARGDINFIVENRLPIWEFQRTRFDALKKRFELAGTK